MLIMATQFLNFEYKCKKHFRLKQLLNLYYFNTISMAYNLKKTVKLDFK